MPTPQRTVLPALRAIGTLIILSAVAQTCFTASRGREGFGTGRGAAGSAADDSVRMTRVMSPLVARLTPFPNGPGVLVCEPVAQGADPATADFGAGCARWLHLIVGGHGEFSKTPAWWSVWHAQRELNRPNMRLDAAEAARLPRQLGITHVALGEIRGDSTHCSLTYRWWKMPARKPMGQPVTVTGSEDQVVADLPKVAARLCRELGVKSPRVPSGLGETAGELRALGALPWLSEDLNLSNAQRKMLMRLPEPNMATWTINDRAYPLLLAGFMGLLYSGSRQEFGAVECVGYGLTKALPDNALVWSEFMRRAWSSHRARAVELPMEKLAPWIRRFPHSYLFQAADSYAQRIAGRPDAGRAAAERAVRCNPRNPDAWLLLNGGIFDQADAVRHARVIRDLTPTQLDYCSRRYDETIPVVLQSIRLAPRYAEAWETVSAAAAFQGNDQLADTAFWKALELDPGDEPTYEWGLQLYQPKWLNDEESLARVIELAAKGGKGWTHASRFEIASEVSIIADQIHRPSLKQLANPLLRTDAERAELQRALQRSQLESQARR